MNFIIDIIEIVCVCAHLGVSAWRMCAVCASNLSYKGNQKKGICHVEKIVCWKVFSP